MRYKGNVIRPPSEADSYLLQVTYGCSKVACTFCGTYIGKKFGIRPEEDILEDIAAASRVYTGTRRVFLLDGDAMVLSAAKIDCILDALNEAFPKLQRIGVYFMPHNIADKTDEDLARFREKKLGIGYIGLESGSDEVLRRVKKPSTADEMVDAVLRFKEAGIKTSVIVLLGLGSHELTEVHAIESAKAVNRMNPEFISFLTYMPVPGTPLGDAVESGDFHLLNPKEMLQELRLIVENLELEGSVFRSNHASNYLGLKGKLPTDKKAILDAIDKGLSGDIPLRPEYFRGL